MVDSYQPSRGLVGMIGRPAVHVSANRLKFNDYSIANNSTSKIKVASGPIAPPLPFAP